MKNRLIINLLLIILLISLGIFAWLKPGQEDIEITSLSGFSMEDIHTIKIKRATGNNIELKRVENQWQLTQPIKAQALSGKIERLLKISQIKPPVSYPLERSNLAQFGLDAPEVKISFNNKTFDIGITESIHSRRYVSNDTQLFLLDDTFLHHLTAPVNAYIDTLLLPNNIQIIGLQTPQISLKRQADNTWLNTHSPADELSSDAVQMLLDEWRFARAISVSTQLINANTEPVIISLNNHQKLKFNLIRQENNVVLISSDKKLAYTLSNSKYKKMTTLPILSEPDA